MKVNFADNDSSIESNKSFEAYDSPRVYTTGKEPFDFNNLDLDYYGITDIDLVKYLNIPYKDKTQEQITYVKNYIKRKGFFKKYINLIGNYRFLDLIERLEFQTCNAGDYMFKENEKSQFVYFLMSGELGAETIPLHKKYISQFYNWEYELQKSKKEARSDSADCFKKNKKEKTDTQ